MGINVSRLRSSAAGLVKALRRRRAVWHRARLTTSRWIGVTGSCGKSTTCRVLSRVLSAHGTCSRPTGGNYGDSLPVCILRVQPGDQFVVQEIGTHLPGSIRRLASLFRPEVAIVTNIGTDHYTQFKSMDAIAEEKADLVRALPADGVAVLNADDARVVAMATLTKARVVTFGIQTEADYRACEISAAWPDPISFVLEHNGEFHPVQTSLFGRHFVPNVLASLAVAHTVGMPLAAAIAAVRGIKPLDGRLSEVRAPDGVTFILDDYKAPWWGLPLTVDFITEARAKRKILVLGEMSDNPGDKATKLRRLINSTLDHVDRVVVVGPSGRKLNTALLQNEKVTVSNSAHEAHQFLNDFLKTGDLVVLKGNIVDHLERLAHARVGDVGCWRSRCGRGGHCAACDLMAQAADPDDRLPGQ